MRMVLSIVLAMVLLASAVLMAVIPASAAGISGEYKKLFEGDSKITRGELANAILPYMLGGGALQVEELRDAAHVYAYWNGEPRSIVDSAKRTVTIYRPVKRIVVYNSDAGEAVQVLGAEDKVVGIVDTVQKNTFYFPEMSTKTFVGKWDNVEFEKVVELKPDLVISYVKSGVVGYYGGVKVAEEKLSPFGIPVAGLDLYDPDYIPTELSKLSILLESEGRASEYIEWLDGYKELVEGLVSEKAKPKVFITTTGAIGKTSGIPTDGPGTAVDKLCNMTGAENIGAKAPKVGTKYEVNNEWVLNESPDIIIMKVSGVYGWDSETEPQSLVTRLLEGKGWDNLNATKNNSVYAVPWSAIYGMEQPFAMTLFAKIFHPEIEIKNPTDVYNGEFLEEFMGISYPEGNVFVYPPLVG